MQFSCIIVLTEIGEVTISGTSESARATAKKFLDQDPNYFRKLAKQAKKPRGGKNSVGSFKAGDSRAKEAGKLGGQTSRRTPVKNQFQGEQGEVVAHKIEYVDFEQTS